MVRSCLSEQVHDRKQHNIPFSLVIKNIPKFLRSKMSYYKDMTFYIDQSVHTVATFSGVLIGNDIEYAAVSAYL